MKQSTYLYAAIAAAIAQSEARTLNTRQTNAVCDGNIGPNLNDCDSLISSLGWSGTSTSVIKPGTGSDNAIEFFNDHHNLNCLIRIDWNDDKRLDIVSSSLMPYIGIIKTSCIIRSEAGGSSASVDDNWTVTVKNDPQFNPQKPRIKRQGSDDTFRLDVLSKAIERPGHRQPVGPSMPSGSTYTVTKGETDSTSVGASFDIGGELFKIFSLGASTSFESTHTVENSQSNSIPVSCEKGQNGQIFWAPKWDHYEGVFMPSNTAGDVWNPLDSSAGRYVVECTG